MRAYPAKTVALLLTIATGVATLVTVGWLTVDAFAAHRRAAAHAARVETLRQDGQHDASLAAVLHEEYETETLATLARNERSRTLAWTLLTAAAAFLLSAGRLIAARPPAIPTRPGVVALPVIQPVAAAPVAKPAPDEIHLAPVDQIIAHTGTDRTAVIPILQAVQAHYRHLPAAALRHICQHTDITPAQLMSVATFYPQFRHTPVGEHVIKVCHGTACHVAGAARVTDELRRGLAIAPDADTDAHRKYTLEPVACMGCCTLAPVLQVDGTTHGHLLSDTVLQTVLTATAAPNGRPPAPAAPHATAGRPRAGEIRIGLGSCCVANGSGRVHDALSAALGRNGTHVSVKRVGCVGMCHHTPLVELDLADGRTISYARVTPEICAAIVRRHFPAASVFRRLHQACTATIDWLRRDTAAVQSNGRRIAPADPPVAAFLGPQVHIATEHCGNLDPTDLDEYLAHGGFTALRHCRAQLTPAEITALIERSGLRGRGGAGFPTAAKWAKVRAAPGRPKYIICNGDEGDPGAFMDRMLMESYPYRIIEGVAIAAHATGATAGIFYIRREYPLAAERIRAALQQCDQRGLLSDGLHLRVVEGAGAFVCGEESALIATLEGRRGTPSLRPPYPAERGLHGRPTLVGNVETYALVPWIIRNGPEAFAALGTPTSTGTKVFALAGNINRGGLIEVPMGITVRRIVEDIGGGVPAGRRLKAVQIGGPSGGCIPAHLADTPVDYEALTAAGAMMGSGGLVVLDDTDCMVDMARYFLSFTQEQSCGKCAPCRVGTRRLLDILERLCAGQGRPDDLAKLEHLARMVQAGSLCGLGRTAPNPVLTALRYFRDEFEAHLAGRCPAGKCRALIRYEVTADCTGCTLCAQHCPVDAITPRPYERHTIDTDKCTCCDACRRYCPEDAIAIVSPAGPPPAGPLTEQEATCRAC